MNGHICRFAQIAALCFCFGASPAVAQTPLRNICAYGSGADAILACGEAIKAGSSDAGVRFADWWCVGFVSYQTDGISTQPTIEPRQCTCIGGD
jgi:hypothetical protein